MLPPRAYTFIGLNIIRVLSIIALILVFSSSLVVMVNDIKAVNRYVTAEGGANSANSTTVSMKQNDYILDSTVPNQPAGAFWAVLNRLLIIGQTIVLLMSEIGWPAKFFNTVFPVLGKDFGLGALGLIQCLLGAAILSHHVDNFALVSAFFLFSIGCLNIFVGLIFRSSARGKRSVTSWREHKKDVLPKTISSAVRGISPALPSYHSPARSLDEKAGYDVEAATRIGYGFGRQGEKAAASKGFLITKPVEALPRYLAGQTTGSSGTRATNPFRPALG
jgi:hypothetical protein